MGDGENKLVNASIVFIAITVFIYILKEFKYFLIPFVLALILTMLTIPIIQYAKSKKVPAWLAMSGLIALLIIVLFLIGTILVSQTRQIEELIPKERIGGTINTFDFLAQKMNKFGLEIKSTDFIDKQKITDMGGRVITEILGSTTNILSEIIVMIIFLMFLIPSYEILTKKIQKDLKRKKAENLHRVITEIEQNIKQYLYTKTIISLGTGILSTLFLLIFDAKLAIVFGFIIFLLNYIPNIGSIVAVGVTMVAYFITYGFSFNFFLLFFFLFGTQMLFGNIIEPEWEGIQLKLSPILIILSLFFWGWVWGIAGMFLAVPLTSILKIIFQHFEKTKMIARYMQ